MALPMPTLADLVPLGPEIFVCGAAFALLMIDLFLSDQRRGLTHFLALFILAAAAVLTARDMATAPVFGFADLFVRDTVGDVLKIAVYVVAAASFVYAKPYLQDRGLFQGEFYVLGLFAVLGMMLMISAGSLLTLYLGLELQALAAYGLVAMDRDNPRSSEAAIKYFVLGSLASGLLLYGMSMVYGATGSLMLGEIHAAAASTGDRTLLLYGVVFMLVGIAFKFGAAPFHMWLPDVYHGAPTPITLFIGSAPKLAAFGMTYRLLEVGVGPMESHWQIMLAALAVLSLAIGNLSAIMQSNFKRMLAYSTVSHVGFLFMGFAGGGPEGFAAAMFYAMVYALMATAAFGAIVVMSSRGFEADRIDDYKGLNARNPWMAGLIMLTMFSLAGVPPFLGFWAKLSVLRAAIQGDMLWLAIVGIVFAVIGAFYYLRVVKVMYFDEPEGVVPTPTAHRPMRIVLGVNAVALLALGLAWNPIMAWCRDAFGI